jgi:hypothetical protein
MGRFPPHVAEIATRLVVVLDTNGPPAAVTTCRISRTFADHGGPLDGGTTHHVGEARTVRSTRRAAVTTHTDRGDTLDDAAEVAPSHVADADSGALDRVPTHCVGRAHTGRGGAGDAMLDGGTADVMASGSHVPRHRGVAPEVHMYPF